MLTLDPIRVHLDDLVHELDREAAFALGLADLISVTPFAVDEVQDVQSHGNLLLLGGMKGGGGGIAPKEREVVWPSQARIRPIP